MHTNVPVKQLNRKFADSFRIFYSRYIQRALFTQGALRKEQMLHNRLSEWYYKVNTYGIVEIDFKDSVRYEPTPYLLVHEALNRLNMDSKSVFLDIGCGKGRSLVVAAQHQIQKIVGVELDKSLIEIAQHNMLQYSDRSFKIEWFNGFAQAFDYTSITHIFIYNSFGEATMRLVLDKIKQSLISNPRLIQIAYVNPQLQSLFEETPWLEAFDLWMEKDYPDFHVYPKQPFAVSFWKSI